MHYLNGSLPVTHPHPLPQAPHTPYTLHAISHPPLSPSHKVFFSVYLPLENHITIYLGPKQSTKYFLTFLLFIRLVHFFLFPPMVSVQTTVLSPPNYSVRVGLLDRRLILPIFNMSSLVAQMVKNLPTMQETWV